MKMEDTISYMLSVDYTLRMVAEYWQTKIRYEKLHRMLVSYDAGTLSFELTNVELLRDQAAAMGKYLYVLEVRAEQEGINLDINLEEVLK